jgi:hypothetical protein
MDTYLRNEVYNKNKRVEKAARNEEELLRNKNIIDMKRIKQIKSLRNEVELMYRSSRMNQEKFCVLRAHSPIPDLNDRNGYESVGRYLPPLILKEVCFYLYNLILFNIFPIKSQIKPLNLILNWNLYHLL